MWIKTQGGYLLNLDNVDFVRYNDVSDMTYAHSDYLTHVICEGDGVDKVCDNINRGTKIMEVR